MLAAVALSQVDNVTIDWALAQSWGIADPLFAGASAGVSARRGLPLRRFFDRPSRLDLLPQGYSELLCSVAAAGARGGNFAGWSVDLERDFRLLRHRVTAQIFATQSS